MKSGWKRILVAAVCVILLTGLIAALADAVNVSGTETAELQGELWAGKRKTTPTPKPRKTPKPSTSPAEATPSPTPLKELESIAAPTNSPVPDGPIIDPQSITDWLYSHDFTLPDNFITKKEAQQLGWGGRYKYVSDVAPGMSIGGDRFGNYEELLPTARGRKYYECDCYYTSGKRNAYRLVFSNDGLVFYTEDHYQTFVQMYPSDAHPSQAP